MALLKNNKGMIRTQRTNEEGKVINEMFLAGTYEGFNQGKFEDTGAAYISFKVRTADGDLKNISYIDTPNNENHASRVIEKNEEHPMRIGSQVFFKTEVGETKENDFGDEFTRYYGRFTGGFSVNRNIIGKGKKVIGVISNVFSVKYHEKSDKWSLSMVNRYTKEGEEWKAYWTKAVEIDAETAKTLLAEKTDDKSLTNTVLALYNPKSDGKSFMAITICHLPKNIPSQTGSPSSETAENTTDNTLSTNTSDNIKEDEKFIETEDTTAGITDPVTETSSDSVVNNSSEDDDDDISIDDIEIENEAFDVSSLFS